MGIKLIGSALVVLAGVWASLLLTRYEKRRVAVLDGYVSLIRLIRSEIGCASKPLDHILRDADPALVAACIGRRDGRSVPAYADLASMLTASRVWLGTEAERLLGGFASSVGSGFREEEVRRCGECLTALIEVRSRLADGLPARLRTGCTLCVTAALSAALLMW